MTAYGTTPCGRCGEPLPWGTSHAGTCRPAPWRTIPAGTIEYGYVRAVLKDSEIERIAAAVVSALAASRSDAPEGVSGVGDA